MKDDPVKESMEFNQRQDWYSNLEKIPVVRDEDLAEWENWWISVSK
jgi:hypothetical protein